MYTVKKTNVRKLLTRCTTIFF